MLPIRVYLFIFVLLPLFMMFMDACVLYVVCMWRAGAHVDLR